VMDATAAQTAPSPRLWPATPPYTVTAGSVRYRGRDCWSFDPEQRARIGLSLVFQVPIEIPGVKPISNFCGWPTNARRSELAKARPWTVRFEDWSVAAGSGADEPLVPERSVNEGFLAARRNAMKICRWPLGAGGGDSSMKPIPASNIACLRIVAGGVNQARHRRQPATLLIHALPAALDVITPHYGPCDGAGRILRTGGKEWPGTRRTRLLTAVDQSWPSLEVA